MKIVSTLFLSFTIFLRVNAYSFDCGVPNECTDSVLNTDANGYTCGARIEWVMSQEKSEDDACLLVATEQFQCNKCMPILQNFAFDCGLPDQCTAGVLNTYAGDIKCGNRIQYLMIQGQSEEEACANVAKEQSKCEPCNPSVYQAPATVLPLQLVGEPVWSDEFDSGSTPSSDFWSYDIGRGPFNDGWGNWEVQHYEDDSSNVNLSGGKLNINVLKQSQNGETNFTSGRIKTNGKIEFQYGSVEASIKLPDCSGGLWPAFWLLGGDIQDVGWPNCGELDILEAGNKDSIADGVVNKRVSSAAHWSMDGNYAINYKALTAGFDLNHDFHTYRMDWTPEFVNTFVDGNLMWSLDIGGCKDTHCTEFHQPFYFILNVAVGGTFTGITDKNEISATTPGQMQIDYIRIYNNEVIESHLYDASMKLAPPSTLAPTSTVLGSPGEIAFGG